MKDTFAHRLAMALNIRRMKAVELSNRTGLSRARISHYMHGDAEPRQDAISRLAEALNVSEAWLMGYNVMIDRQTESFDNIRRLELKQFPLLGTISCGEPIWADEDHTTYFEASANIKADFCLVAKGDSMINARINDGDVVFIKKQSIVDNGAIAAVIINNEATLKRWYYYPDKQKLVLSPENPRYEPLVYMNDELDTIRCLGKAVCFMGKL